jgi:hypothetical protein
VKATGYGLACGLCVLSASYLSANGRPVESNVAFFMGCVGFICLLITKGSE